MRGKPNRKIERAAKRLIALSVCIAFLAALSGCPYVIVGGAAATGVFYYKGELRAQVEAPPDEVMAATQKAFDYFKWSTLEMKASRTDGIAKARTAAGKEINVSADAQQARLSVVSIRVGTFGDENLSQILFEKIKDYLSPGLEKT